MEDLGVGDPGIGDGGNEPVGDDTYFFFPLSRRINFLALSILLNAGGILF